MVHPHDQELLEAMLGLEGLPKDIQDEYELRAGMFHRFGGTGALPMMALIDLCRFLGYKPPFAKAKAGVTEWAGRATDGSVRVKAGPFFGAMQLGVFIGEQAGQLLVRLDDGETVKCRPDMLILVEGLPPVAEAAVGPLDDDEMIEEEEEFDDMSAISAGTTVLVEDGDGSIEAEFVSMDGDQVVVKINGKKKKVDASRVIAPVS